MNGHLQTLQQQVDQLFGALNAVHNKQDAPATAHPDGFTRPSMGPLDPQIAYQSQQLERGEGSQQPQSAFSGPTSSTYFMEYSNPNLQNMGIADQAFVMSPGTNIGERPMRAGRHVADETPTTTIVQSKTQPAHMAALPEEPISIAKDPLWCLTQESALTLCHVYADEIGLMYPILDLQEMMNKIRTLFSFLDSARRVGLMKKESERGDSFDDDDSLTMKLVLAAAATVQENGHSDLGDRLFENVRKISNLKGCLNNGATIGGIKLLVVTAQYHFHKDEEVQAYRVIGIAARQCYELGLHRSDIVSKLFTNDEDFTWAVRLFWATYVLDRRWSFGTGLPFAMQDADIDPNLPEADEEVPYLKAMVQYGRISSKVWTSIAGFDNTGLDVKRDQIGYLDYQIQQWQNSIPAHLKYTSTDNALGAEEIDRGQRRLRLMIYLRANQLRIQLYRPVLYTLSSIMENRGYTQTVIEIAKDTIRTLMDLNQTSDIHRSQQVCFHYYLVAALAVLFLAVSHAPNEFSRQVREEFYMALDLIKGFSCNSYISKRLWKTVKGLKKVAPRLGLPGGQTLNRANDPHSSAAVAMAGLAGHAVDESTFLSGAASPDSSPISGMQLSHELTQLFETAGGYGDFMGSRDDFQLGGTDGPHGIDSFSSTWGNDEDFLRVMRECF
jgi:hypothetical protein